MKRLHIHLSVEDLADNIQFYSQLFGASPSVVKDDYAKWMLEDPRVNFAISQRGAPIGLNHLGIQAESNEELEVLNGRLQGLQQAIVTETAAACCYAVSDKYWINDPQGIAWEQFHTLDSIPVFGGTSARQNNCCTPETPKSEAKSACCTPVAGKTTCC
ncbi:ArsI/CadI family heavy metal resistance metalloenzyme [Thiolinea disciformis]|uniref:ArsI/CadI family heavy metal resistance metalloenzyme n=1 Tax=Thiolinea disciformis TaxID=125614 RepID=UPI0003636EE8|nr:ArsI/CadI family heavy metal resistance metalloenzyme [Thiolinea disciformis]